MYQLTCATGHQFALRLQHRAFEILFEMGVLAILDGYYREAVLNFAASAERFCEFYVRFSCFKQTLSETELDKAWKRVSAQSERQLGAFLLVYALENKRAAPYLSDKAITFRNHVVHKGYIPTGTETVDFGDQVLSFIRPILDDLKVNQQDPLIGYVRTELAKSERGKLSVHGLVFETILSHAYGKRDWDSQTLHDIVASYPAFLAMRREKNHSGFRLVTSR